MSRNQNSEWPLIKQGRLHVRNSHLLKGREATEITLTAYKIEKKKYQGDDRTHRQSVRN